MVGEKGGDYMTRWILRVQKRLYDFFMRLAMKRHIKKEYFKKGITPTAEQVLSDINPSSLSTLISQGYFVEDIKGIVEEIIGRHKCKE